MKQASTATLSDGTGVSLLPTTFWDHIDSCFRNAFPRFDKRSLPRTTTLDGRELIVAIQLDRIAAHGRQRKSAQPFRGCALCSMLQRTRTVFSDTHAAVFYDFPPLRNQLMLLSADHYEHFRDADVAFFLRVARALGAWSCFAGKDSGASHPEHFHFHLVPSPLPIDRFPRRLLRRGKGVALSMTNPHRAGTKALAITSSSIAVLMHVTRMIAYGKVSDRPYNIIFDGQQALYYVPRLRECATFLNDLRMGAVEPAGLFCLRTKEQQVLYERDPLSFHRNFHTAQEEVGVSEGELSTVADRIIKRLPSR